MKVLCIGESVLEVTCHVNDEIKEGKKLRFEEKSECGGGAAGNIAYLLSKWGVESYIASMLGSDDDADKIKKEFENIGVKTDYIETSYDKSTGRNLVLVNKTNKNSTVFELASNANLRKYSFGIDANVIVSDGCEYNATIAACDKYPGALSFLKISKVNNEILELCKFSKFLIFNKEASEEITKIAVNFEDSSTLVNIYNRLKQRFNTAEIIVTLGERGCLYAINSQVKIMPPVRGEVVNTYAAGDIFSGAFIYSIIRSFGLEKALAYASIAASFITTKLTSKASIPTLTEVTNYYDSKFGVQNNPNNNEQSGETNMTTTESENNDNQQNA